MNYNLSIAGPKPLDPTRLTFLDLPGELRNLVYDAVANAIGPNIFVEVRAFEGLSPLRAVHTATAAGEYRHARHEDERVGRSLRTGKLAISETSRQIASESLPFMYKHTFVFMETYDLDVFLRDIGQQRKYVRHVELLRHRSLPRHIAQKTFSGLLSASNLTTLELDHRTICQEDVYNYPERKRVDRRRLEDFVEGFLCPWSERFNLDDRLQRVACLVKFTHSVCHECGNRNVRRCANAEHGCPVGCFDDSVGTHLRELREAMMDLMRKVSSSARLGNWALSMAIDEDENSMEIE